ncbi:MAG: succinate dehydrogenase cytochrome b subunit [Bacteroidales bacterium]
MSKFIHYSSLTKKYIMSIAGFFLMMFLIVHLGINLFILPITENHEDVFRNGVEFMTSNPLIKVMEVFLFAAFIIHIIYGAVLQIKNWMSRPVRYRIEGWSHTSFFSKFMIHTGIIVFIFLVIHLMNFYLVKEGFTEALSGPVTVENNHDFYHMAINLFTNTTYSVIYILFIVLLGFHLNHAFQSAFQSLGWNHSRYTPVIKAIGNIYSIVIPLGFILIPLYFIFLY